MPVVWAPVGQVPEGRKASPQEPTSPSGFGVAGLGFRAWVP